MKHIKEARRRRCCHPTLPPERTRAHRDHFGQEPRHALPAVGGTVRRRPSPPFAPAAARPRPNQAAGGARANTVGRFHPAHKPGPRPLPPPERPSPVAHGRPPAGHRTPPARRSPSHRRSAGTCCGPPASLGGAGDHHRDSHRDELAQQQFAAEQPSTHHRDRHRSAAQQV